MASPRLPVISVKGKPFDCGQQYGTLARELIRRNVDTYFDMWHTLWGIGRPEILKQCRNLVPIIGEYDAGILEELEGVAMGFSFPAASSVVPCDGGEGGDDAEGGASGGAR